MTHRDPKKEEKSTSDVPKKKRAAPTEADVIEQTGGNSFEQLPRLSGRRDNPRQVKGLGGRALEVSGEISDERASAGVVLAEGLDDPDLRPAIEIKRGREEEGDLGLISPTKDQGGGEKSSLLDLKAFREAEGGAQKLHLLEELDRTMVGSKRFWWEQDRHALSECGGRSRGPRPAGPAG